ncbi:MAG TPA: hypothetical protein VMM38_09035 [Aridibacter sp.]|nr:hypothetical protein [Aridibacter sp.]
MSISLGDSMSMGIKELAPQGVNHIVEVAFDENTNRIQRHFLKAGQSTDTQYEAVY